MNYCLGIGKSSRTWRSARREDQKAVGLGGWLLLKEAVDAFQAALEGWNSEDVPLKWANAKNNLGNALAALGRLTSDEERLNAAVSAFESSLTKRTYQVVPSEWAQTKYNLSLAENSLGDISGTREYWQAALDHLEAALEVANATGTAFDITEGIRLRDHISAKLNAQPPHPRLTPQ